MTAAAPRLAAAVLLALVAVAGSARAARAADELVFWAMGSEADVADQMLAGFRQAHPDIPVRVQQVPWSAAHEKLLTAFVGGSMPDVFQLGNTWLAEMATLGALEPLDQRVAASPSIARDDYFPGVLDPNVIAGRLVALPWYVDTRLLFYRSDLTAGAKVADAPKSWDQWKAAMEAVRATGGSDAASRRFGAFLPVDEWQVPVILALQRGASLLKDGDTRGNFRSDEVRTAFAFYAGLFAEGLVPTKSEAQVANLYREFAAGYFAYFVTGPWNLVELLRRMPPELATSWATAPMPAPLATEDGSPGASLAGGASLAISATSAHKDAAFKLLEYLSTTTAQADFRMRSGDLPSRRSAWDLRGVPTNARAQAFRVQLEHLVSTPKVPEWERIASKVSYHLERVVRGDTSLDQALADLDADVDAILAKRRELVGGARP